MGVSYTIEDRSLAGNLGYEVELTAQFDTSYSAGGEPLTASDAGLKKIDRAVVENAVSESGYVVNYEGGSLVVYEETDTGGGLGEVADLTDLSTESATVRVYGTHAQ